jgi:hypothetical protein
MNMKRKALPAKDSGEEIILMISLMDKFNG